MFSIIYFILIFFSSLSKGDMVTSPEGCYTQKSYPCAIVTLKKKTLSRGGNGFYVSANSFLVFESKNHIQWHRGVLWAHIKKNISITTKYGILVSEDSTDREFFIYSEPEIFRFSVVEGDIQVQPKGGEKSTVLAGRSAYLSSIDYATQSCFLSGATVIDFHKHLKTFNKVFPFGSLSVEQHLVKLRKAILLASNEESELLKETVSRRLASEEAGRLYRMRYEQDARRRDEYLKQLFRLKSNFEEI